MSNKFLYSIRSDYNKDVDKKRDFNKIRKFFDIHKKNEYTLDNQTWDDLNMNKVYEKLDRAYSSPGEAALYTMLRNPLMNEEKLKVRGKLIETLKDDNKLRESLQCIFFELNSDLKNSFLDMIENNLIINRTKYFVYTVLGRILPVAAILLAIFVNIKFMLVLFGICSINMLINSTEVKAIKSNGIFYLQRNIKAAKKIASLNNKDIIYYRDKISTMLKSVKDIDRSTRQIGFVNMWGGMFEFVSVIFLFEESAYYSISDRIKEEKEVLMDLYYTVGELEALISIAGYKHILGEQYAKPKFINGVSLNIKEGIHPLIDKAVANTIGIDNGGIVLTGTNMAGEKTFFFIIWGKIIFCSCYKQWENYFYCSHS